MSIDGGMNKKASVHIYTVEYWSTIKKEWNTAIYSNMGGCRDDHTKWSEPHRERQVS